MRLLFLGDIVGRSGRKAVVEALPSLRARYKLDFVIINAENSAGGFGITESIHEELLDAGADVVTLGNHAFDQKDALVFIGRQERLLRPLNFPRVRRAVVQRLYRAKNGLDVLVINAMGRVFMTEIDCPFRAVDREITACGLKSGADVIFIDFHAEATSEEAGARLFPRRPRKRVSWARMHSPTADERVLPGGTGFMSDAGMCGDYNSVLGMDIEEPINRFLHPAAA